MSAVPGSLENVPRYDVIVIGGGINGAAVAREAALAGFSVALFERSDLCCATTAASTRLIHGGLRYLEHAEFGLVYESLHERERLVRDAAHLVEPVTFYIPVFSGNRRRRWQISMGLTLYDVLSIGKSTPWHRMLSRDALLRAIPSLRSEGLSGGACFYDAQVTYPERLVVELCVDAAAAGALIRTHANVERIITADGNACGIEYSDAGATHMAAAPVIVNATGPWVDRVVGSHAPERLIGGTRGSHLALAPVHGMPDTAIYTEAESDGRPFFIVPWNGLYLIGTTDVRYDGDPADVHVTEDDYEYLLGETRRLLPGAGPFEHRVVYGYAGTRALPYRADGNAGAITRRHHVHAHKEAGGLYSIIGGKLTTHRALAEDVMARIRRRLPRAVARSSTRRRRLPGFIEVEARRELEAELTAAFDARLARRLLRVYGSAAADLLSAARASADSAMVLGPDSQVLVAELELAIDRHWARDLTDIMQRRCMAGLDADRGIADAESAARWLVRLGYLDREQAFAQLNGYRQWLRQHRSPVGISAR